MLLPTVERENLDLQSRHIADYNRELLAIAGILSRAVYDAEMGEIARLWKETIFGDKPSDDPAAKWLLGRASHLLHFFTFRSSTPIAAVGQAIQASFFNSNTKEFLLVSSKGIVPSTKVRLPAAELSFLSSLSVVPDVVAKENVLLLDQLQERNLLKPISIDDVITQLNEKPLAIDEAIALLIWWISLSWNPSYDPKLLPRLCSATIISMPLEGEGAEIVALAKVKYVLNAKVIPPDLPLPSSVLPVGLIAVWQGRV